MLPSGLPVDAALPALRAALRDGGNVVLEAPPGAGKSTIVPLALLDEPWVAGQKIVLLEPRRLAARAVAQRMAALRGEPVGATVGYRMRFDTRVSAATRIEVLTEGVLTRMLQDDPALEGVAAVLFDEFHERSLAADLGLALTLDAQANLSPALRIVAMSATLDGARIATLLQAPRVQASGRAFDVQVEYVGRGAPLVPGGRRGEESAEQRTAATIVRACETHHGDLLAFLPGAAEIRRVHDLLRGRLPPQARVHALYGELSREAQDAALTPAQPPQRRVILSTNVAETSLTIEGVRIVVDSGLVRRSLFDPGTGMSRLETLAVSRASAEQRRGRAGRLTDGVCYRLWSEGANASLAAYTPPEILSTDLAPLALELAAWGVADAGTMRWLDAPPAAAFAQARELLARLGALDAHGRITAHGRAMAREPLQPRLAHMLIAARERGLERLGAELAALLSERELLRGARDADVTTRLAMLRAPGTPPGVDEATFHRVRRVVTQLARGGAGARSHGAAGGDDAAGLLLALAFPDRVAQRRADPGGAGAFARYLLANGRGAAFAAPDALARAEYLVALDLDDVDAEARIRLAAAVSRADLEEAFEAQIETDEAIVWDAREQAVSARRRRRLGALVLEDRPLQKPSGDAVLAAMLDGVRQLGVAALPWDDGTRQLQARLQLVRTLDGSAQPGDWPASDDVSLAATLDAWLAPWLDGATRAAHLARVPLAQALTARLTHAQRKRLDELAPRTLTVPTGSALAVDYLDEGGPSLAVRLQEVFGLADTPRVGGGRVPVTLKLLSPARRPVQITRDLAGFWRGTYADVRKDMRGRYPRHYWPENPLEAEPTRGVRRTPR